MSDCELGPGANKISEMLFYNNSIVSIDLSCNGIEDSEVEKMVHHLSKSSQLQHLNLIGNKITAVGANYLRRLLATDHPTLTSIELYNPLEDKGVHIILSSLTVAMDHIGLVKVSMTSSSFRILAAAFHKTKSISFECDDYGNYQNHIFLSVTV